MKKMAVLLRVKSTLLGVFFTASPFASIFAVDALRYSFNFMDSAGMFYGLLLLLQVIIGYIGAKVNQATKVVKDNRILKGYVLLPVILVSILPPLIGRPTLTGNGFLSLCLEAFDSYIIQMCGLTSVLCFFATNSINNKRGQVED